MTADFDDDNDGVADSADAFPVNAKLVLTPSESNSVSVLRTMLIRIETTAAYTCRSHDGRRRPDVGPSRWRRDRSIKPEELGRW